jgi:aryl-alcohol dehydrogenase-like predicted oxidoreductase
MDLLLRQGKAFYWGTSEWSAAEIREAHRVARELGCIPPAMEQPQYNLLVRERVEREYAPLYEDFGMGLTTWSPLYSGLLTGKYSKGVPAGSRLDRVDWLKSRLEPQKVAQAAKLAEIARELECTPAQLAIAWCLKNARVSTVILGASRPSQLQENLGALAVRERLGDAVMARLDALFPLRS